jgi:VIT1/CCC1 family predicted Fe2+/Mn2+ transporter
MTTATTESPTSTSQLPGPGKNLNTPTSRGFFQKVWSSLHDSIGEIVFGMEDGTVSIFGLVFGVAATAPDATTVLLAGATGAAAAAVSMMAGTFLDVESARDQARAQMADASQRISRDPAAEARREHDRLTAMGFSEADAATIVNAIQRTPDGTLQFASAFELQIGDAASKNPVVQSLWMFIADLFAASVPVLPFAFLSLFEARLVSIGVTTLLLLLLGLGRGLVGRRNVLMTMLETLLIAAVAAGAGLLIGQLVTRWVGGA